MADDMAGDEADQQPVIGFLSDPAAHGGAQVTRVDTHISRIFLAGDRAWKMKRALRTNYLDFTTLERREQSCRREIAVNAAAGDLYLGVVPVVRRDGGLRLGGAGEPVEWLVEMRRFDRSGELAQLCDRGGLSRDIAERLADEIARMHRAAPVTPGFGDDADLDGRIEQIAGALQEAAGGMAFADAIAGWRAAAHRARIAHRDLVARRCRGGRIRRCHGDLHLGNVVMIGDRPVPFDAIEFNEAIASIDVLYDLALTLSDLVMRGHPELANAVLNRYLGATRDYAGLSLMPLFLSMRGAVRAMTAASRGAEADATHDFAFAQEALKGAGPPRLIAIGGLSGSGKSSVARALAPGMGSPVGAVILRSDVVRKRLAGIEPETPLAETAYSAASSRRVLVRMARDARVVLRTGWPVVLDATFLGPEWRSCAERLAQAEGVPFDGIWLDLPVAEAIDRVGHRGQDASDATADVVRNQSAQAHCPAGWIAISAVAPLPQVLAQILTHLPGLRT